MKPQSPPRLLETLLRKLCPPLDRENLVGDYQEVYHRIVQAKGKRKAVIWYLGHIIRLVPIHLENETARRERIAKTLTELEKGKYEQAKYTGDTKIS